MEHANSIYFEKLPCGAVLIVENIPHLKTVAYQFSFLGGIVNDPQGQVGASLIVANYLSKGAGGLTAQQIADMFDTIGFQFYQSSGYTSFVLGGQGISDNIEKALKLNCKLAFQPDFPPGQLEPLKKLSLMELDSLQDQPTRLAGVEFSRKYYNEPWNRSSYGEKEDIANLSLEDIINIYHKSFGLQNLIISIAGNVNREAISEIIKEEITNSGNLSSFTPDFISVNTEQSFYYPYESEQVQIILAYPSCLINSEFYYAGKVLNSILSGGMYGRLFTEVREKRGLCYSVYSSFNSNNRYGTVSAYAGTTTDRAEDTLATMIDVFKGLKGSIKEEELEKAKINITSNLVFGLESAGGRAGSNLTSYRYLNKIRTIDEMKKAIKEVSLSDVYNYLDMYPYEKYSLLSLGKRELKRIGV